MLICTLASISAIMHAQEEVPVVTVVESTGSEALYATSELAKINMNKDFVELVFHNAETLRIDKKSIARILLQGMGIPSTGDVKVPLVSPIDIYPHITDDIIGVKGLEDSAPYRVFALDGTVRLSGKVSPEAPTVSIAHLPPGIYLLTVGNHTFKVTRK